MNPLVWSVPLGVPMGLGLWVLVSLVPRVGRPPLPIRVAPYVADVSPAAREIMTRQTADPLPVFGLFLEPLLDGVRRLGHTLAADRTLTERRLQQAGLARSVDQYRSRQLLWAAAGTALAAVSAPVVVRLSGAGGPVSVGLVALGALAGFTVCDVQLKRRAAQRIARMERELPTILEFLTLSLSAGEGVVDAVARVARTSHGELARELRGVITDVHSGVAFPAALWRVSARLELAPLTRVVEQIVGALDRGTPLAEVLRAHAHDARDEAKRLLLESSGRKEVAMLVPLVMLILPTTIAFAIFPGVFVLQAGF